MCDFWDDFSSSAKEKHTEEASLNVILPPSLAKDEFVVVASRFENKLKDWPPTQVCQVTDSTITILNSTPNPISIPKDVHIVDISKTEMTPANEILSSIQMPCDALKDTPEKLAGKGIENALKINTSRASKHLQAKLKAAHLKYSDVFSPDLTNGYNGASGPHAQGLTMDSRLRP